ncbi:hypothetical protein [Actinorugispora endophytica]|uniref:Sugar lactone lactonase YvrE n=1 Tax=Actinorugispora endophytica TaxID=1605990 RepID=A0A4R6V9T0_9ACTN|nr:hypothetical protein [Actinorugispora endophytica]TDQ53276.1 hypothetical protein EV190_10465 [Actinorugispora endophytica]
MGVEPVVLWDRPVDRVRLGRGGRVLLAVEDEAAARGFDTGTLEPLGPEMRLGFDGMCGLADVDILPGPVVVEARRDVLRTWDLVTGEPVAEVPYGGGIDTPLAVECGMIRGRAAVFVFGFSEAEWGWEACALDSGALLAAQPDFHPSYWMAEAGIGLVDDLLAVPAQFLGFTGEDAVDKYRVDVYRLPEGRVCGSIADVGPREVSVAALGGRPVLLGGGRVRALPGGGDLIGHTGLWDVLVAADVGDGALVAGLCRWKKALSVWFLDAPDDPVLSLEAPWLERVWDMAMAPDGTLFLAADTGVHALRPLGTVP